MVDELGYWIGKPYWNLGYCTEAVWAIISHCFNSLHLTRIFANHFTENLASRRVLQKIGMQEMEKRKKYVQKWKIYKDEIRYTLTKENFCMTDVIP